MTDRAKELEAAAEAIDPTSLQAAKAAVAASCEEYIRWADLFSWRLETIEPSEMHKFARALASPCSVTCPPDPTPVLSASSTEKTETAKDVAML